MSIRKSTWTKEAKLLAKDLHKELIINDKDWHQKKNNPHYRAAELLSSALIQLIQNGNQKDIEALTKQAALWIKGDVKDPGCPRH